MGDCTELLYLLQCTIRRPIHYVPATDDLLDM